MTKQEARDRGKHDAERERAPIFRSTRAFGILPAVDDPGADDWTEEARAAYLEGYYGCPPAPRPCNRCPSISVPGSIFCEAHLREYERMLDAGTDTKTLIAFCERTYWPESR